MSKLDELIQQYCPDGVEYLKIGNPNVAKVSNGFAFASNLLSSSGNYGVCKTTNIQNGRISEDKMQYVDDKPSEQYVIKPQTIVLGLSGTIKAGINDTDKTYYLNQRVAKFESKSKIDNKYLYYVIMQIAPKYADMLNSGSVKNLSTKMVEDTEIPVPPLPVQEEIVRILDKFTELEQELEQELELRKKQYEYYRDKMLSLSDYDGEVEEIHLKDIGKVCMCKRIMKAQTNSDFENGVPFFKIGTFGKEPDCCISKDLFEDYKNRFSYPKKGNVLISAAGTIGRTVVFDGEPAYFQDSNIVWIDNDNSKVLDTYLNYVYQTSPWHVSDGGTISRLYNGDIEETKIVIPKDLDEQKRIVDILDKFSTLTSNISEGLPAEIKMRHQQYEYYRDKLLNFKRLEVVVG